MALTPVHPENIKKLFDLVADGCSVSVFLELLNSGIDVDHVSDGESLLIFAAEFARDGDTALSLATKYLWRYNTADAMAYVGGITDGMEAMSL